MDATLVSPIDRNGEADPRRAKKNGAALEDARRRKERKYPELLSSRRCELVVAGMEVGGRWSEEAWAFLLLLAEARARTVPKLLQRSTVYYLVRRWSTMVAVAAHTAFAASLLGENAATQGQVDDFLPPLGVLVGEGSHADLEPSGLPLR